MLASVSRGFSGLMDGMIRERRTGRKRRATDSGALPQHCWKAAVGQGSGTEMMRPIAAIAVALLPSLALAQPLPQAKPVGPGGSCPHGYTSSGSFCVRAGATPAPNGEGYDLNFENVPVATLAKIILGDILFVGYTIDPRVQGTVTLASGRPVPKSELLFVLENELRLSNVALVVHDR